MNCSEAAPDEPALRSRGAFGLNASSTLRVDACVDDAARGMTPWTHRWRIKTRLPERTGQPCRVLARGKLNSCLVEFPDGTRVVTSRWSLRKIAA